MGYNPKTTFPQPQTIQHIKYDYISNYWHCHSNIYDTEDYLRYAHGLISEYISEDLSKALLKHLQ